MKNYLDIFIDKDYPGFIDKYLETDTLERLKHITQFCGCDYTNLYSPLFKYTRFDHSLVVAHMTWHFTHDKKETIVALLHDIGTPCFAHTIDVVFDDYMNQESSERSLVEIIKKDKKLNILLKEDNISFEEINNYPNYYILENKSPKLCTDRLDGVLHTCYIWLHTHSLNQIKEVYNDLTILINENGIPEIGFKHVSIAEKFTLMVYYYAHELQWNRDKYVSKYISELVKKSFERKLLSLDDLYTKKEEEICEIFDDNFPSWNSFVNAKNISRCNKKPSKKFYISYDTKKRNAIPLVQTEKDSVRIDIISEYAKNLYNKLNIEKDTKYAYIDEIENV